MDYGHSHRETDFANRFELQHFQELGVYGDVAVFGDTNLELPSFLSNRSAVEIHMDLGFTKASKLKGGFEINIAVPLHARYPAPGENGYSSARFGDCDIFIRCSSKLNVRSEPCLSILMARAAINPIDGHAVWEIPCGIQTRRICIKIHFLVCCNNICYNHCLDPILFSQRSW
ncbi:hypothetical protein MLD38_040323 [Melastoma candidum]|uniref:Uncharacterized protein n=1 Tax=Melastoma candidum TaxID=119954 RepID=A0ACB9L614_9MYRT|nr:hypothetical protein MLD38_040323 [Melastoma candidum]